VVEGTALEKRQARKGLEGSNPSLSSVNNVNAERRKRTASLPGGMRREFPLTEIPWLEEESPSPHRKKIGTPFRGPDFLSV
jgi:hypothetical protein